MTGVADGSARLRTNSTSGAGTFTAINAESVDSLLSELGVSSPPPVPDEIPDGWQLEPEALAVLIGIIKESRAERYLEVGAHRGATSLAVARAMHARGFGRTYAIEPDQVLATDIEAVAAEEGLPVVVIQDTSWGAFNNWGREPLDVILVDGDHSLAGSVFDLAAWSTLLSPDGWLLIHDTVTRLSRRFPEDYLPIPEAFNIVDIVGMAQRPSMQAWEGLAVLRWSAESRERVLGRFTRRRSS